MVRTELYEKVLFETIKRGATEISPDVKDAFETAIKKESNPDAKKGLIATLNSMEMSKIRENPLCVDTGWPIFYFKVGNLCQLEGGFVELENAARRAVAKATERGYLRATMKHPLTGYDPGNNIGMNIPDFTYQFVEGDHIEISYAAKGGGSECYGGTRHRIVAFADERCVPRLCWASALAALQMWQPIWQRKPLVCGQLVPNIPIPCSQKLRKTCIRRLTAWVWAF